MQRLRPLRFATPFPSPPNTVPQDPRVGGQTGQTAYSRCGGSTTGSKNTVARVATPAGIEPVVAAASFLPDGAPCQSSCNSTATRVPDASGSNGRARPVADIACTTGTATATVPSAVTCTPEPASPDASAASPRGRSARTDTS